MLLVNLGRRYLIRGLCRVEGVLIAVFEVQLLTVGAALKFLNPRILQPMHLEVLAVLG